MTVIDATGRFYQQGPLCRFCDALGVVAHFPHIDHRRRKPWPETFWTCLTHDANPYIKPAGDEEAGA